MVCNRNFILHDSFVEAGGVWSGMLGRKYVNKTLLLPDGMQIYANSELPPDLVISERAISIAAFKDMLKEKGIEFLFVLAPYKMDTEGELLPEIASHSVTWQSGFFVQELKKREVDVLHLRDTLADSKASVEKYFYKTDHHWNGDAIMVAANAVERKLSAATGEASTADFFTESAQTWRREVLPDWFWGSLGRRTGHLFSGCDDLIYYEPVFTSELRCVIPDRKYDKTGDFRDTVMDRSYIEQRQNPYLRCAYDVYLGGPSPEVRIWNSNPRNKSRLLIVADSFGRPLTALLAAVHQEVAAFDPRSAGGKRIADAIDEMKPDTVLFIINETSLGEASFFSFTAP